jgi:hypothetical protein
MAGKIVYGTLKVVGNTAEYSIVLTGNVISSIAELSGKKKLAANTKRCSKIFSKAVGKTVKITAAVTAVVVDKTIDATINTAKYIGKNAVETSTRIYGESERFYDKDKYIEVDYRVEANKE